MTQPDHLIPVTESSSKPLWPLAALILGLVFAPAFLAFALTLLR